MPKGGGAPWDPPKKAIFSAEFCDEYYTIYLYTINNHIQANK